MIITRSARVTIIAILYAPLILFGAYATWKAAPDAESALFPPVTDIRYIPFDPQTSDALFVQQLDRTCWRVHFHKARDLKPILYTVTWMTPDGARYFSEPVSGVTGYSFNSLNSKPGGFTGDVPICSIMPDNFDATRGYTISTYAQFDPPHHFWPVEETFPLIRIPPIVEAPLGAIE